MVDIINAFIRGFENPLSFGFYPLSQGMGYELIREFRQLTGRKLKPSIVYPFSSMA